MREALSLVGNFVTIENAGAGEAYLSLVDTIRSRIFLSSGEVRRLIEILNTIQGGTNDPRQP